MIFIKKNKEPVSFKEWKNNFKKATYKNLKGKIKADLRNSLLEEQGYICCFCGAAIGVVKDEGDGNIVILQKPIQNKNKHNVRNAHIVPQSKAPQLSLNYNNICASCGKFINDDEQCEEHCDLAQKDSILPITPLQKDCENFFSFNIDGTISPNINKSKADQKKAEETINILKLNTKDLINQRYEIIRTFSDSIEKNPTNIDLYVKNLSMKYKDSDGINKYAPFFFVALKAFNLR